jgi:myo-inositol-1(or 4)-monophosphatase
VTDRLDDLGRIRLALEAAAEALRPFTSGAVASRVKSERGDPVTEADLAVDGVLRRLLPRAGEGWLSEETADDADRLSCARVWVVDPLDGTREFVDGIPEWCVSVGLLEEGEPVAGGVYNPATDELIVGSLETGLIAGNAVDDEARLRTVSLAGARVLASRSEVRRGEWDTFRDEGLIQVVPCGSVAYKLGLVAAGKADATWTLVPKHEWDVVAGVALVRAAGLVVMHADGATPRFNQPTPWLPNLLAGPAELLDELRRHLADAPSSPD